MASAQREPPNGVGVRSVKLELDTALVALRTQHYSGPMSRSGQQFLAALGSIVVVGLLDHATGTELSMSLFYAVPIFLISWSHGFPKGTVIAIASVSAWGLAQVAAGAIERSPGIFYWNAVARLVFFLVVAYLAKTKRKLAEEQSAATTDFLTEIANRRGFSEAATREVERARRSPAPLTVVYIDCDNFKAVNDSAGHSVGNALLRTVGKVLRENSRGADVPARLGGDEFALLLVGAGLKEGEECLARLQSELRAAMRARNWPVTFSIGAVCVPIISESTSVEELLRQADRLMYQAKDLGKNRIVHQLHEQQTPSLSSAEKPRTGVA